MKNVDAKELKVYITQAKVMESGILCDLTESAVY